MATGSGAAPPVQPRDDDRHYNSRCAAGQYSGPGYSYIGESQHEPHEDRCQSEHSAKVRPHRGPTVTDHDAEADHGERDWVMWRLPAMWSR